MCGEIIPTILTISVEEGLWIAAEEFRRIIEERYPNEYFEPPDYQRESESMYIYIRNCPAWISDGFVPGCLTVGVDKHSGNIY